MFDTILTIAGLIGVGLFAAIGAHWTGKRKGAADANARRDAQNAAQYIEERKRQDEMDIGLGATDPERISRLHEIANRGSAGKN